MPPKPARRFKPIDERIEALTEVLPDSERKLAELLTAQPALLATHSATELAAIAGSSKAAVTRFIQRLGYDGFATARREAREAQRWGAPNFQAAAELPAAAEEAFGEHLRRDLQNLAVTFERLTHGVVEPALATLARAFRSPTRIRLATSERSRIGLANLKPSRVPRRMAKAERDRASAVS